MYKQHALGNATVTVCYVVLQLHPPKKFAPNKNLSYLCIAIPQKGCQKNEHNNQPIHKQPRCIRDAVLLLYAFARKVYRLDEDIGLLQEDLKAPPVHTRGVFLCSL